jgi:hypothetical protein
MFWFSIQDNDAMRYELFKSVLWAKSLLSLSAAYEVAAAGRALGAVGLGAIGLAPLVWRLTKRLVEGTEADFGSAEIKSTGFLDG